MRYAKTKIAIIALLIIGISFFHIKTTPSEYGLHILHSELFFFPVILASFWFGLRLGVGTALLVCFIYAPLVVTHGTHSHDTVYPVLFTQLTMYLVISLLIGWLSDRRQAQQKILLAGERATALAKAASALNFEIKDVVSSLDRIHQRAAGLKDPDEERNFRQELDRLNQLVETLARFVPKEEQTALSTDLNYLLESSYRKYHQQARKADVEIVLKADPAGCPSMIAGESLGRVLDALIDNALEVSKPGQKIHLISKRGGTSCSLEVTDEGSGVAAPDRKKLFTPFFTTKPEGNGLALAAGRKVLRDHGGDLIYLPGTDGGSTFRMIIPRENVEQNIDEFVREQKVAIERQSEEQDTR